MDKSERAADSEQEKDKVSEKRLPLNYVKMLEDYCEANKLSSPQYVYTEEETGSWVCRVNVGKGEYDGPSAGDKKQAALSAAAVAYTTCTKAGSVTGEISKAQYLKLFFNHSYVNMYKDMREQEKVIQHILAVFEEKDKELEEKDKELEELRAQLKKTTTAE